MPEHAWLFGKAEPNRIGYRLKRKHKLNVETARYRSRGMGSGASAAITAKFALGHPVKIVGVVSAHATSYADSISAGRVIASPVTTKLADGMASR